MRELQTYQVHVELRGERGGSTSHETLEVRSPRAQDVLLDTFHVLRAAEWSTAAWFRIVGVEGPDAAAVAGWGASPWQVIY